MIESSVKQKTKKLFMTSENLLSLKYLLATIAQFSVMARLALGKHTQCLAQTGTLMNITLSVERGIEGCMTQKWE